MTRELLLNWRYFGWRSRFVYLRICAEVAPRSRRAVNSDAAHGAAIRREDRNIYEKHGLDVQLILVNSGSLVAQMFQAGELQITANAPASLVNLAASGEKLTFFSD